MNPSLRLYGPARGEAREWLEDGGAVSMYPVGAGGGALIQALPVYEREAQYERILDERALTLLREAGYREDLAADLQPFLAICPIFVD